MSHCAEGNRVCLSAADGADTPWPVTIEHLPDGVLLIDAECRIVNLNAAGLGLLGARNRDEVRGQNLLAWVAEEHRASCQQGIGQATQGNRTRVEYEVVSLQGRSMWVEQDAVRVPGAGDGDEPPVVLAVSRDITERKRAEAALRESEERLRIFVENTPAGVAMLDRDLRYITHSRRWLTDYDLGDRSLLGRAHYEVFPEIPERWTEVHRRCLLGLTEICDEDMFVRADGRVEYLHWEIRPWWDRRGSVGGLVIYSEIITDRVTAERALRTSEERLAEAQKLAHLGSWTWEIPTDRIAWSDETYRIFGHAPQSFVPRYEVEFLQAVHPDDRELVVQGVNQSLRTGEHYMVEHRILRTDGHERRVREQGMVEIDEAGQPTRMFGTVQDITERAQAEEQLQRLRDELAHIARLGTMGEMATGMAHELNQPLTAITNYASSLRSLLQAEGRHARPQELECLQQIEDLALHAGRVIRRLRNLVRKISNPRSSVNLAQLIDDVLPLIETDLRLNQVNLQLELPASLPLCIADSVQLQQVLVNMLRNSLDVLSTHAGERRITVSAAEEGNQVRVAVSDSGPGVVPEVRKTLFQPFVTSKPAGLGLGLAISRQIIEAHGGEIRCDSGPLGSTFSFTIPLARPLRREP